MIALVAYYNTETYRQAQKEISIIKGKVMVHMGKVGF